MLNADKNDAMAKKQLTMQGRAHVMSRLCVLGNARGGARESHLW